jgi:hypothetical protein
MRINEMKEKKIFSGFYSINRKSSRFCLMNDSRMRFLPCTHNYFRHFRQALALQKIERLYMLYSSEQLASSYYIILGFLIVFAMAKLSHYLQK